MIDTKTNPRDAALLAFEACEYATMHPSAFSDVERYWLYQALKSLEHVADRAREVC